MIGEVRIMSIINSVHDYPVDEVFKKDASFCYSIPKYQRPYVWKGKQWKELYDDITSNNEGYFIGSIICISNSPDAYQKSQLEVIDGQQRLTTLILLLTAIYSRLIQFKDKLDEEDLGAIFDIKKSIVCKNAPNGIVLCPQVDEHNMKDFLHIMGLNGFVNSSEEISGYSKRRIPRCYAYFCKRIDEDLETSKNKIKFLLDIKDKVFKAILVKIEVSSHAGAYTLFESLNDRGTPLVPADLMKNHILARAEAVGLSPDACHEKWKQLIYYIGDEQAVQERFFRQYYNAFKSRLNKPFKSSKDKKKDPLGTIATKTNILNIIEQLINYDLDGFLDDILESGRYYSWFVNNDGIPSKYRKYIEELCHVQGTPSYMLLMYLLKNQNNLELSDRDLIKIIKSLTVFFVRRNSTDVPNTRDINRILMGIISEIESSKAKGKDLYTIIYSSLKSRTASDEQFAESLSGPIYEENVGVARFVLCALAEKHMTNEKWCNLWERYEGDEKKYKWTIEHIFPEGENIPKCWVAMIANGDRALAKRLREEYVHKLGNLTITGYNSNLSNLSFDDKKNRKNENGKYIGYKNGLEINKSIVRKKKWTVDDIDSRTENLVNELLKMYSMK